MYETFIVKISCTTKLTPEQHLDVAEDIKSNLEDINGCVGLGSESMPNSLTFTIKVE